MVVTAAHRQANDVTPKLDAGHTLRRPGIRHRKQYRSLSETLEGVGEGEKQPLSRVDKRKNDATVAVFLFLYLMIFNLFLGGLFRYQKQPFPR